MSPVRSFWRVTLAMASTASLAACVVGPTYKAPIEAAVTVVAADTRWVTSEPPEPTWWRAFGDPELDALIERALVKNLDLRVAVDRVTQARALFRDQALNRFPRVTTDASYSRSNEQVPGFSAQRVNIEQADLGFDATWEIDLFGRVRHQVQSARADAQATRRDLQAVHIAIAAEVARNYLALRGAQAQERVAEENASTERDTARLIEVRYQIGSGDPVDVQSAKARLDATQATLPALRTLQAQAAYRLAVLLGQRPGSLTDELTAAPDHQQPSLSTVVVGDVTGFLRHRPDVQAAERRLAAETARTGVATADLFPRVNVTGFIGLLSGNVSTLFKGGSQAWAVSPTVTWPGLDIGGARARLRAQTARQDESRATYDLTVLRAIEELQNALTAYHERQIQVSDLSDQVLASRRASDLAQVRYKEGHIDFLRVLDAERTRLEAEETLTVAATNANIDVVSIYQALGGAVGTDDEGVASRT